MTICEGIVSELRVLENLTVDEYYAALYSYVKYKEKIKDAYESARERGGKRGRRSGMMREAFR